jgi:hypothetical protein
MTQSESTPSEQLKKLRRASNSTLGLKPFARYLLTNDKKQAEIVTAWFANKRGTKKPAAPKPKAPEPKPAPIPARKR